MTQKPKPADRAARCLSGLLALAVWVSSFGAPAARAAGSVLGKAAPKAPSSVSIGLPSLSAAPGLNGSPLSAAPSLNGGVLPAPAAVAATLSAPAASAAAAPVPLARISALRAPSPAASAASAERPGPAPAKKPSLRERLAGVVKGLGKSPSSPANAARLNHLYSGGLNAADDDAVETGADFGPSRVTLKRAALGELVAAAVRTDRALDSRLAAIRVVAKVKSPEARRALETIADSNPEGGAADYEVHRAALRALDAAFGELRSLRPISETHKNEILASLKNDKPELLLTDYDGTLAPMKAPIGADAAEALASAGRAGVETVLLTGRSARRRYAGDLSIFDSLAAMTPAQTARLTVLSDDGAKTSMFDRGGSPVPVDEDESAWSPKERLALEAASRGLRERFGDREFPTGSGRAEVVEEASYIRFLPSDVTDAELAEAERLVQETLKKGGVAKNDALARRPADPRGAPYVLVSKVDKSVAAWHVRKDLRFLERSRDALRFGGGLRTLAFVKKLSRVVARRPVPARKTLILGDAFMPDGDAPGPDALAARGAPGARAIAVGGTASPRLDGVFVWPAEGPAASVEILEALAETPPSGVDRKAVGGMFAQRTVSIASYILTTIAFTAIAVPVVGWVGYGALMAIGSLAPIAVGPLNGWIVDRLSARDSMAMNTAARIALDFLPPVLVLLGMVSMPTLIIAAIANFWVLSSVMTTEGAYIKRLAGQRFVGPVNSMLWMNYLIVQVVLALILGFGGVVGAVGPVNAYFIAAAINAFIALPIVWFTMPNAKPLPKTIPDLEAEIASLGEAAEPAAAARLAELRRSLAERERALKADLDYFDSRNAALAQEDPKAAAPELALLRSERAAAIAELSREARAPASAAARRGKAVSLIKRYGLGAALLGASVASYFFLWASPIPVAAALGYLVIRTDAAKLLWAGRARELGERERSLAARIAALETRAEGGPLDAESVRELADAKTEIGKWKKTPRLAVIFLTINALTLGPLQSFGIPRFTEAVTGLPMKSPESSLLFGQYLGALFLGSLIANAAQVRLPEVKIPLIGRVAGQRFVQATVAALVPLWTYTNLFPGNLAVAAGAFAAAAALMALAAKLTNRAWLQLSGLGMAGIWLPYFFWGSSFLPAATAMFLAVVLAGMVFGPSFVSLKTIFESGIQKSMLGRMIGVQGSLLNAARSISIGGAAAIYGALNPAFPAFLAVLGGLYAAIGIAFYLAPRFFPSLPKTLLRDKESPR